jgi:NADH:ubiquinone oxidoreductase subunit 3 (subunit A)
LGKNQTTRSLFKKTLMLAKRDNLFKLVKAEYAQKTDPQITPTDDLTLLKAYTISMIIIHAGIVSFLFWGLSALGLAFYFKDKTTAKKNQFECGFDNTTPRHLTSSNQLLPTALFMLLYDVELLFLLPIIFFHNETTAISGLIGLVIISAVAISCVWDTISGAIYYNK